MKVSVRIIFYYHNNKLVLLSFFYYFFFFNIDQQISLIVLLACILPFCQARPTSNKNINSNLSINTNKVTNKIVDVLINENSEQKDIEDLARAGVSPLEVEEEDEVVAPTRSDAAARTRPAGARSAQNVNINSSTNINRDIINDKIVNVAENINQGKEAPSSKLIPVEETAPVA